MADEILLIFTNRQKPVVDAYLETVASGGLHKYRALSQYGIREGQNLYSHLICGGLRLHTLSSLFDFSELETRLLMAAFSIHDLNKLYEAGGKGLRQVADDSAFFERAIQESGVNHFFPEWESYAVDLKQLILGHGAHSTVAGEQLFARIPGSHLDKERLRELTHLMRAADVADLSKTFEERTFKDKFVLELNSVGVKQFRLINHRLGEHRGVFSNIIHNNVSQILQDTYNATPIFLYPEGSWYLVDSKTSLPERATFHHIVSQEVRQTLIKIRGQDLAKLIELSRNAGVKIDRSIFSLQLRAEEIVDAISQQVFRYRFDTSKIQKKIQDCKNRLARKLGKDDIDLSSFLEAHQLRYPESEDEMRIGELIRALYNLTKTHLSKEVAMLTEGLTEPWEALYHLFEINGNPLEPFDKLNDRPFVLAGSLRLTYSQLHQYTIEILTKLLELRKSVEKDSTSATDFLSTYLDIVLYVSFAQQPSHNFGGYFSAYAERNHRQCCYSAFVGMTQSWMSPEVPEGISVQQFSNRLDGGSMRDPKRNVCPLCREQFFLEQMLFCSGGTKGMYLHFFPDTGLPEDYLSAIKQTLDDLLRQADPDTFFFPTEQSLIEGERDEIPLHLSRQKALGFSIPLLSEAIGNVISLTVFPGWDRSPDGKKKELPNGKRVLISSEIGLRLAQFLGLRCMVSESPIPPLIPESYFYVDTLPVTLQTFFGDRACNSSGAEALIQRYRSLRLVDQEVRTGRDSIIWELARSLGASSLEIFAVADRALERKLRQGTLSRNVALGSIIRARICQPLRQLTEGDISMNDPRSLSARVKKMADIATKHKLWGRSRIRRNSLLSPLNITFENLRRKAPEMDLPFIQAQTIEDVFTHINRVRTQVNPQFRIGMPKRQAITSYVNEFFGIVEDIYQERLPKIFSQEKAFKAAYLCFLSESMATQNLEPLDEESEGNVSEMDDQ